MSEEVRSKNEERTTSDYMLEIEGHYLMNGCDDCPFYDIVKTCDSIPIHCNWMLLKNYFKAEEENPALSWDELKTMEGKPVWIEWASEVDEGDCDLESADCVYKYWCFVYRFLGKDGQIIEVLDSENDWHQFYEERLGSEWKAYRKERE